MDAKKSTKSAESKTPANNTKNKRLYPPPVLKIKSDSVYSRTGVKNVARELFPKEEDKNKNSK